MKKYIIFLLVVSSINFSNAQGALEACKEEVFFLRNDNKYLRAELKELSRQNRMLQNNLKKLQQSNNSPTPDGNTPNLESKIISNNPPRQNHTTTQYNQQQNTVSPDDLKLQEKVIGFKEEIRAELAGTPYNVAKKISIFNNHFDTYIIQLNAPNQQLNFLWKDTQGKNYGSLQKVKERTIDKEVVFSTNGGMYSPDQSPQGLLIQDGVKNSNLDMDSNISRGGNFYLQPNGVFLLDKQNKAKILTTENYINSNIEKDVANATQSGPMLVIDGRYHPAFIKGSTNKKIRSGVGVIDENTIVFAISKLGVNFYDFARLFKDVYGCEDALFLDGVVSQMYCPELERYDVGGNFGAIINLVK